MGGGWGGGHMSGGWGGRRVSEGHLDHGHFDHAHHFAMEHEHDHFHHRFVRNRFFFAGGGWPNYYDYDYGYDCSWLRRQAVITGSPYWWRGYELCAGYY